MSPPRVRLVKESRSKGGLVWIFMEMRSLTVRQRQRLCDLVAAGVTISAAALVVGCSRQTASKWVNRRRRGESLRDRSSRPHSLAEAHACASRGGDPARARRAARGAACDRLGARRRRLDRARCASPPRPLAAGRARPRRRSSATSASSPGELIHVDIKKLGRILLAGPPRHRRPLAASRRVGRLAVPVRRDRRPLPARLRLRLSRRDRRQRDRFLDELVRFYGAHGIEVERVLTDNGSCFKRRWADACAATASPSRRRAPTGHRQTGKRNGSSARCSSAGPTPTPTTRIRTTRSLAPHSTSTIASVPTAPSRASHRSSASTTSLGHTPSPRVAARDPRGSARPPFRRGGDRRPAHRVARLRDGREVGRRDAISTVLRVLRWPCTSSTSNPRALRTLPPQPDSRRCTPPHG